jgi:hypothetical protein
MGTYEVTTDGGTYQIETEDAPKSVGGLASNFASDIASPITHPLDTLAGLGQQIKTGALDYPKEATDTLAQVVGNTVAGQPIGQTPMAKRAADISESPLVQNPKEELYKHPGNAAMLAAPMVGAFMPEAAAGAKPSVAPPETPSPEVAPVSEGLPKTETPSMPSSVPPTPTPGATPPKEGIDPLQQVKDYVTGKYGQVASKPGFIESAGKYIQNESQKMGGHDLGLQPRQIQSMGQGLTGVDKAHQLIDYARDNGYLDPGLSDVARVAKVRQNLATDGQQLEAVRDIASKRSAPPIADIRSSLETQLTNDYGIDAPGQIKTVLAKFDKAATEDPTFSGMADLATQLNKAKTPTKSMGQHPGPTTDAANIISQMNNDAIRGVLNPQEQAAYTDSLRNYGATRKLEQAVAAGERKGLSARTNQRGILGRLFQEALDRGGYRVGGNVAHRIGSAMVENPSKFNSLPKFFEELAHHTDDVLDEAIDSQGMAHGGIVGELDTHLTSKYGNRR